MGWGNSEVIVHLIQGVAAFLPRPRKVDTNFWVLLDSQCFPAPQRIVIGKSAFSSFVGKEVATFLSDAEMPMQLSMLLSPSDGIIATQG